MRNERKFLACWTASALLLALMFSAVAEEKPSPLLTALSSTTISGYVDVSAHWNPACPAAYPVDAPCWETTKPWSTKSSWAPPVNPSWLYQLPRTAAYAVRFHELVDVLRSRGFAVQISAPVYSFHQPQIADTIAIRRTGPFATTAQISQLRAYVARHHL